MAVVIHVLVMIWHLCERCMLRRLHNKNVKTHLCALGVSACSFTQVRSAVWTQRNHLQVCNFSAMCWTMCML